MILFTIFAALFIIVLSVSFYAYRMAFMAPKRVNFEQYTLPEGEQYKIYHPIMQTCIDEMLSVPYEELYHTSFDGTRLFARFYPGRKNAPIHLMFHGYKSNPYLEFCGGSKLALSLEHNVIVVDQRSHGKSQGKTITFGVKERRDVLSWIEYCRNRFGADVPILLWGLSMGAATVLMATDLNLPDNVAGIIADCPFSSPGEIIRKVCRDMHLPAELLYPFVKLGALLYGHFNPDESSAASALKQNHLPILLFHGDDDRFVPCEMSNTMKEACPEMITLEIISGAGHGLCYMVEAERYQNAIIRFLQRVLPTP